jgi:hypothetical protein
MMPLAAISLWRGRKRRGGDVWGCVLLLVVCAAGGMLTACGIETSTTELCTEGTPVGGALNDNALFIDPGCCNVPTDYDYKEWQSNEQDIVGQALNHVIDNRFGDEFGSLPTTLAELGVSSNDPILLTRPAVQLYDKKGNPYIAYSRKPEIAIFDDFFGDPQYQESLTHEVAHYWDQGHQLGLSTQMGNWVNWGDPPTEYATENSLEDFAESVTAYLWPDYDGGRFYWTDDFGVGADLAENVMKGKIPERQLPPGSYGKHPYADTLVVPAIAPLEGFTIHEITARILLHDYPNQAVDVQVRDRYDYVQCMFGHTWKEGEVCP